MEQLGHILIQAFTHALSIFANKLMPLVDAGGAAEASGTVPLSTVYITLIVLAGLGIVFGVALAIVAARFVVKIDPKVEKVRDTLPGANCGACGFAGCMGYAEAVVGNPDVAVSMCAPGKSAVAEKIAEITGKKAEKIDPKIARVFCQGGSSLSQRKFIYTGVHGLHGSGACGGRRQVLRVRMSWLRHLHARLPLRRDHDERRQPADHQ